MKKPLGLKKAMDLMRMPGTRLMRMFTVGSPEGYAHYIIPGGYVEPDVAEKIKNRPDVIPSKDGLFPNADQTWRIVKDEDPQRSQGSPDSIGQV